MHCLAEDVDRNWDHVFPRAWYGDDTPADIEKWQIPSCYSCNDEYGKLENDLLSRLGLSIDPNAPGAAGITKRALRSLNPAHGKSARDSGARRVRAEKLASELFHGKDIPRSATIPGLNSCA